MPVFEWTGSGEFNDNRNDRVISPGERVELSEDVAGGHREFVEVDDAESNEGGSDLPDLSGSEWQGLASAYDGFEDVNGKSSADDIKTAFKDLSSEEQSAAVEAFDGE